MPTPRTLAPTMRAATDDQPAGDTAERSLDASKALRLRRMTQEAIAPGVRLIRRGVITYVCALLLIAVFTVMFHFITDSIVQRQDSTARVVNLSGRQRMLSQRIAMLAVERATHVTLRSDAETVKALNAAINLMAASHQTLLHGSGPDGRIVPPPPSVFEVYFGPEYRLDAKIALFLVHARAVANTPAPLLTPADPHLAAVEQAAQEPLLTALNAAVTANQTTSEDAIAHLRRVLLWLAGLMLLVLLMEALWLYRPLFKKLEAAQVRLVEIGRTDPLTGCLNRRAFTQEAQRALSAAMLREQALAVLMIDIDHFKAINDRFGHPVGDTVINAVVNTLLRTTRQGNPICRMGGEEFAILLRGAQLQQAMIAAERLRAAIEADAIELGGHGQLRVEATVSIGVAALTEDDSSVFQLLNRADGALYTAKRTGRNKVSADPTGAPASPSVTMLANVRL